MSEHNFLSEEQSKNLSEAAKTVKENAFLSLGVYPMLVDSIESRKDKNQIPYLRINFNTGYEKKDGGARFVNQLFYLEGEYPDGKKKVDDLARFMKVAFKISSINNASLGSIIGKKIAVATRKDPDGFIQFWYAESIDKLETARASYKPKKEDARFIPPSSKQAATPPAEFLEPEEPDFLRGIEIEGEENEDDDIPFK